MRDHVDRVAAQAGRVDICFNLISHQPRMMTAATVNISGGTIID